MAILATCTILGGGIAHAENTLVDVLDAASSGKAAQDAPLQETHEPLRLTPDRSEIVRLESDAKSVLIGNPAHFDVVAETTRLLVITPKLLGASYISILDAEGNIIMQRHVIVGSPKDKYVRVRKTCYETEDGNKASNCQPTDVYYCPDGCHNINVAAPEKEEKKTDDKEDSEENSAKPIYEDPNRGTEE